MTASLSPEAVLRTYFRAKDENRPHLMSEAFCRAATLRMDVKTEAIAFPAVTVGIDAVSDVLVRSFGQSYDNVYSFYLDRPPADARRFSCDWLVGMTEKASASVRVGCGRYDWEFDPNEGGRASQLVVTIEAMEILEPGHAESIFDWLCALSYPWSSSPVAAASMPEIGALASVRRYLERA